MFIHRWWLVCSHTSAKNAWLSLPCSTALFYLKVCQLLKHFRDTNYSEVSGGLQQSGVALKPLFPNDILLFISQAKHGRKKSKQSPKIPNRCFQVPAVHISAVSKLQFSPAASFLCGVRRRMKAFFFPCSRSAAWRNGLCGSMSSQNWTEPSAHLSISLF